MTEDWRDIAITPEAPMMALLFYGDRDDLGPGVISPREPMRDQRFALAYFNERWFECGTGHEIFEPWAVEQGYVPTMYMPIRPPVDGKA